ncbi:hypothetical protein ACJJTC_001427, partial [Scirpophaga incertulas]
ENDRLKEQLRKYMSAVEVGKALKNDSSNSREEVTQYERKLVQVAEMHAELMEFNQYLQKRVQELEALSSVEVMDLPVSNVKACIPSAFLVGNKTNSYHVYQDSHLVEQRRVALQAYLRHILLVLPELRECTNRAQLITLLPFFGTSSTSRENGLNHTLERQRSNESYEAL